MSVKLNGKLPKDRRENGLSEVDYEAGDTIVVARLSAKSLETLFADDVDDNEVLKLSIVEIEELVADEAEEATKLLDRARARRTGEYPLEETDQAVTP